MLRSLHEHAVRRDQIAPVAVDGQAYKWQHRIAALVHGWTLHAHNYADFPILLSDVDYDAALALAESGSTVTHPPALSSEHEPRLAQVEAGPVNGPPQTESAVDPAEDEVL